MLPVDIENRISDPYKDQFDKVFVAKIREQLISVAQQVDQKIPDGVWKDKVIDNMNCILENIIYALRSRGY